MTLLPRPRDQRQPSASASAPTAERGFAARADLFDPALDPVFERMARTAASLCRADWACLWLLEGDHVTNRSWAGRAGESPAEAPPAPEKSLCQELAARPGVLALEDASATSATASGRIGAFLAVPLHAEGDFLGGFCAISAHPRSWTDAERRALEDVAELATREIVHRARERSGGALATQARLTRLVNLLPVGVYLCDNQGDVVFYNQRAAMMWGQAPRLPCQERAAFALRPLERPDGQPVEAHDYPAHKALAEATATTNREFTLAPGRTVLASWGPAFDPGGRTLGAAVVLHDVTEVRQAAQLRDDLLALVSHELRTPLTVINGMARVLERRVPTGAADARTAVEDILGAGQRMERAVENMLLLSRLEYEAAEPEPVLVSWAIGDAIARHRRDFPASRIEVVPGPHLMALAVPSWLQLILVNLLANAEQYGDRSERHIVETVEGENTVSVLLSNSGPGHPEGDYAHWFEPFYRGTEQGAADAGAGLGLTVARRLAEAQSGTLEARGWAGGTTLALRLPRQAVASSRSR
jgi:signal transduction histidine kinase